MHLEQHTRNCSEIPRLTRAQRLSCISTQRAFISSIIEELGPHIKIEYTFDGTDPEPAEGFAKDLLNTSKIILKLAYHFLGDLHSFGVFFKNGQAEWEEIQVTSTYWLQEG
jgi:hypothetical protein